MHSRQEDFMPAKPLIAAVEEQSYLGAVHQLKHSHFGGNKKSSTLCHALQSVDHTVAKQDTSTQIPWTVQQLPYL